jgi:hypothetical protein
MKQTMPTTYARQVYANAELRYLLGGRPWGNRRAPACAVMPATIGLISGPLIKLVGVGPRAPINSLMVAMLACDSS